VTFGDFLWSDRDLLLLVSCFSLDVHFAIFSDHFSARDLSGWSKSRVESSRSSVQPFLGILIYLIVQAEGRAHGRRVAGAIRAAPAARVERDEIAKAAQLYEDGKITADDFRAPWKPACAELADLGALSLRARSDRADERRGGSQ
jgi:hypothetical protein